MKYRAITSENFYYTDIKRTAKIVMDKRYSREELIEIIKEKGIIEYNTEYNFNKKFLSINKRINKLNEFLIIKLAEESPDIGKFINLFSIVLNERIFYDFFNEVIKEKYFLLDYYITNDEFISFMNEKEEQEEEIKNWSSETKRKIIVKIKAFLVESGYLVKTETGYKIIRPLIPDDIISNIEQNYDKNILRILLQMQ